MSTVKKHATLPALPLTNHPADSGSKELPMLSTHLSRHLAVLLVSSALLLGGIGCNGATSGVPAGWTPAQQQLIDSWPTTTAGMLANLRASVEVVSKIKPDRVVVSQIALTKDLSATDVIHWFEQYPSSSFVVFYVDAGKIGGGFYNFRPEAPANEGMIQTFRDLQKSGLAARKRDLDRTKAECLAHDPLCDRDLPDAQEAYDAELARNSEKYVNGLAIRGPARDLGLLINDPRVFSINIESGDRPNGIPFYSEIKDVHSWLP